MSSPAGAALDQPAEVGQRQFGGIDHQIRRVPQRRQQRGFLCDADRHARSHRPARRQRMPPARLGESAQQHGVLGGGEDQRHLDIRA